MSLHFIGPLKPSLTLLLKLLVKHYTHPNLNPKTNANIRQICYVIGVIIGKLSHWHFLYSIRDHNCSNHKFITGCFQGTFQKEKKEIHLENTFRKVVICKIVKLSCQFDGHFDILLMLLPVLRSCLSCDLKQIFMIFL